MREFYYPEKYKEISDEKLVCLCREGVQDAFTALSVRFIFVLRKISMELQSPSLEADDLFQEGLIGLNSAVCSFNENAGASFRTFAVRCIRNRMVSAVRKANSSGNLISNSALPLSEQTDTPSSYYTEPENALAAGERLREILSSIESELTELERNVLSLYLEDKSYEEISKCLGITIKACDNAMQRVRRKLRSLNDMPM